MGSPATLPIRACDQRLHHVAQLSTAAWEARQRMQQAAMSSLSETWGRQVSVRELAGAQAAQASAGADRAEIQGMLASPWLKDDPSQCIGVGGRLRRDHFKGMGPEALAAVAAERQRQHAARREQRALADSFEREGAVRRAAVAAAHAQAVSQVR